MTTRKKHKTKLLAVEAVAGDRDLMKALMKEALQEMLEGEMSEFLGAAPGERTESRTGDRAGDDSRSLITRIGKLELRVPRDRNGEFSTALFDRKRWWRPWPRWLCKGFPPARSRRSRRSCAVTASRPAR